MTDKQRLDRIGIAIWLVCGVPLALIVLVGAALNLAGR